MTIVHLSLVLLLRTLAQPGPSSESCCVGGLHFLKVGCRLSLAHWIVNEVVVGMGIVESTWHFGVFCHVTDTLSRANSSCCVPSFICTIGYRQLASASQMSRLVHIVDVGHRGKVI